MKRSLSLVLALMLLFSLTAVSSAFAQEAPVTVTFQTWNPGEGSKIKDIIADFEAENPDIHVEYICMPYSDHLADLQVKLFSGEGPDVYGMNAGAPYATFRDFEVELSELAAAADGENWKDVYLPFCLNLLESDGQYYGLPLGLTYAGFLWADMNYFTKYNLELPTSYDELKAVAAAFRQNGELPRSSAPRTAGSIPTPLSTSRAIPVRKCFTAPSRVRPAGKARNWSPPSPSGSTASPTAFSRTARWG